jgi:hypothetical protein
VTVQAFRVTDPSVLDWPEVVALFERSFADPKFRMDGEAIREAMKTDLPDGVLELWIARAPQHGLCGMVVLTIPSHPISPFSQVIHFVAEVPMARRALTDACFVHLREKGVKSVAIHNVTGATDDAHLRMFRRYAEGQVMASLIVYELRD